MMVKKTERTLSPQRLEDSAYSGPSKGLWASYLIISASDLTPFFIILVSLRQLKTVFNRECPPAGNTHCNDMPSLKANLIY